MATSRLLFLTVVSSLWLAAADAPVRWAVPWPQDGRPVDGYPVLRGVINHEIYHATPESGMFSHHAQIAFHDGVFYASWSSHSTGEDSPGQRVLCSLSRNGAEWREPFECFPPFDRVQDSSITGRVLTSIAWTPVGGTVYAVAEVDDRVGSLRRKFISLNPEESTPQKPYMGRYGWGRVARSVAPDGKLGPIFWLVNEAPEPVEGFARYADARDPRFRETAWKITSILDNPLHMPAWDFRKKTAWTKGSDGHLLCEPSVYRRPDGALVKLSRDRDREASFRLYAATSSDGGGHWTQPERTGIPDSPSKATSGSLPDGRIYLIGNQVAASGHGNRDPLVISLSSDGKTFDWAAAIRHDAGAIRAKGAAKSPGFQYPSAVAARGSLWVIYSIGKEDVTVSQIPISELGKKDH